MLRYMQRATEAALGVGSGEFLDRFKALGWYLDDVKENGGAATLFVKAGDEYVRVATTVKKDDGSSAMGILLYPNSPALAMINKGEAY